MAEQSLSPLESAMLEGDLSKLTPPERLEFYRMRCEVAGLDPRASPFQYVRLSGKLVLYPGRAASDQLTGARGVSVDVLSEQVMPGSIFYVKSRARDGSGRTVDDVGAVSIEGLKGDLLANAMKKAVTQSKRRSVLSFCGLAMPDETEVDQIPGAQRIEVNHDTGEVLEEVDGGGLMVDGPVRTIPNHQLSTLHHQPPHDLKYWRGYAMALWTEMGGDPKKGSDCRADMGAMLEADVATRKDLELEEWRTCALFLDALRSTGIPLEEWRAAGRPSTLPRPEDEREDDPEEDAPALPENPDVPATAPGWKERAKAAMESGATYAPLAGF